MLCDWLLSYFVGSSGASRKKATIELEVVMFIIGLSTERVFTRFYHDRK